MSSCKIEQPVYHMPRTIDAGKQDLMPSRYGIGIQVLSMAAFTLAFVGWLNETWLFWFENPIWLNRYTEYGIILGFGLWRIYAEQNSYTRRRLIILVSMVTVFWWLVPWLHPFYEPYVGFLWSQPVFPSLHVPGTITFFLILTLVFLFGRRIVCGYNCPCVGIRETVGFAFRDRTLRSNWTWALRHTKWFFFIYYVGVMIVTQFPPNSWTVSFVGGFYLIVALTYFGSFFIAPIVGNRFYCRYLCPYGATFGLLNHAGFYDIKMDTDKCIDCQRCSQVCDMGIPVWQQGKQSGGITALEDCMGCGRCVVSCPTDALQIKDFRNVINKSLVQNASHLMKRTPPVVIPRQLAGNREIMPRISDWHEVTQPLSLAEIKTQASRCLDCGMPGCMNACPLSNNIPQWLEKVAAGEMQQAAELAHSTSNMPEVCGTLCPQQRLCEGACTKGNQPEGAVTIGAIERFLTNYALDSGLHKQAEIKRNGRKIAVIGAGPAGIACADELNKAGCEVTVYDQNHQIGGLLASGVPSFKLDRQLLTRRHQLLLQQGIKFNLSSMVDEDVLNDLLEHNDAVFLGTGAQYSRDLQLPGQQLNGSIDALTYLADANNQLDQFSMKNKQALILGGGETAIDCARSAIRQGAKKVRIVYRGKQEDLRASVKEKLLAEEEGIEFLYQLTPVEIIGKETINWVQFIDDADEMISIHCDAVIFAVGQVNKRTSWMINLGITSNSDGTIIVDEFGRTSHQKIYAGGDNTLGPDLVVTAIAAGRRAARGIIKDYQPGQRALSAIKRQLVSGQTQQPVAAMHKQAETIQ